MAAVAIILGLLLGSATPIAIGAMTPLLWAELGLNVAPTALKIAEVLAKKGHPLPPSALPELQAWLIANGELSIRLQPGEITER